MKTKPMFCAWTERNGEIVLAISNGGLRSTVYLTGETARQLVREVQYEIDRLPATVTAADLGIEGAPV